jgi:hypothetical protein
MADRLSGTNRGTIGTGTPGGEPGCATASVLL